MLLLANSGGEKAAGSPIFPGVSRGVRRQGRERIDLIPKANQGSLGELKGTIGANLPFDGAGAFVSEAPPPERCRFRTDNLRFIVGGFFCSVLNPASIWRMVNLDLFPLFSIFYRGCFLWKQENRAFCLPVCTAHTSCCVSKSSSTREHTQRSVTFLIPPSISASHHPAGSSYLYLLFIHEASSHTTHFAASGERLQSCVTD